MPAARDPDQTRPTADVPSSSELATVPSQHGGVAADGAGPEPGRRWARYQVIALLGEGGMGAVYEARDAELDRAVALKVLHDELLGRAGQERLRREARAMARVAHPNVVPVYEVGEHAGRSYYTMELVRGQSFKDWARQAHPWRDVQRIFLDAARGLAAIHGAGLLHRDIKPGNLLLGDDGRARVTDLGIALGDPSALDGSALVDTTTMRNAGTPAYMAPEQLAGGPGDARSDQFAFGVSLFESLHGAPPFDGDALPARLRAIDRGPRPAIRAVPRWLDEVARRAVAADPAQRFADMASLIGALAGPRPRRWPYLLGGATAVSTALMIGLSVRAERPTLSTACATAGEPLALAWGPVQRDELHSRAATPDVVARIDALAAEWRLAAGAICQRTTGTGSWTAELATRADVCMRFRAEELRTAIDDAGQPSRDGAAVLSPLRCLDRGFLLAQPEPPTDPAMLLLVDVVTVLLDLTADQLTLGQTALGERMLDAIDALPAHVDYTPLLADRARLRAELLRHRGDYRGALAVLEASYYEMRSRGDDAAAQAGASNLAELADAELADDALAAHWSKIALADTARRPDTAEAGIVYFHAAAYALRSGDLVTAAGHAERAIELARKNFGERSGTMSDALGMLAIILDSAGRPAEAIPYYQRQLVLLGQWHGPDSPRLAITLSNLALAQSSLGQHDEAIATLRRVVDLLDREPDASALELGRGLLNLGVVLLNAQANRDAIAPLRRGLDVLRGVLGDSHPDVALTQGNLAEALSRIAADDDPVALEAAVTALRAAVDTARRANGAEHPESTAAEVNLADGLRRVHRCAEARPLAEHALAATTRDGNLPSTGHPLQILGQCQLAAERFDEAAALFERAVASRADADPFLRASSRRLLAVAHLGRGDQAAALAAIRARRADLVDSGADAATLAAIDAWLAGPAGPPP